jgi:hypothetical protein
VMTPWLAVEALDHVTGPLLAASQYKRAFIQVILGIEHALYEWSAKQNRWEKKVERKPSEFQGSSFFEVIKDPEWLTDPDGMADRKVAKVRGEMRKAKNKS